jgi:sigma-54 dependent transcriptional regulator, acetoin dehydrogenase operon transcriptional activator AcoR
MTIDEHQTLRRHYELMDSGYEQTSVRVREAGYDAGLFGVDRPGVAWDWMCQTGRPPNRSDWVRPQVAEAWSRCIDGHGLSPGARRINGGAADGDHPRAAGPLADARARTTLANIAYSLQSLLRDSSVTLLMADPNAVLIHVMEAGLVLGPAGRRLAALGAKWQESVLGNNGLGTAAALREAVAFDGREHFAPEFHPYATVGQPIFGPDGELAAVLGLITDRRDSTSALLCLLRLAGHLVEANLFERHGPGGYTLRLRPTGLSSGIALEDCLLEGLLAVNDDGVVIGATQTGLALAGCAEHREILKRPLKSLLGVGLRELLAGAGENRAALEVTTASGRALTAQFVCARGRSEAAAVVAPQASKVMRMRPRMKEASSSEPWRDMVVETAMQKAIRAQQQNIAILITGESGVGKDHLVRRMHAAGPRQGKPLVLINCAAIPRDLISSELFGYEAGSFTGARTKGKTGKFVDAHTGTLFLDEIGDMALELQAALLCALDTSEIAPVGGTKTIKVDVQVVAATNSQLQDCVRKNLFRRDLYYRLNGAQVWLPPLRERPDKLGLIAYLWAEEIRAQSRTDEVFLSDEALEIFEQHPWPGNIRELRNVLRSSMATMAGNELRVADLPHDFLEEMSYSGGVLSAAAAAPDSPAPFRGGELETAGAVRGGLADSEARAIRSALTLSGGNISESARRLGITRATLYHKIARYGLRK